MAQWFGYFFSRLFLVSFLVASTVEGNSTKNICRSGSNSEWAHCEFDNEKIDWVQIEKEKRKKVFFVGER